MHCWQSCPSCTPKVGTVRSKWRRSIGRQCSFTVAALGFILKGKVQQHRQWRTRSFAVALVFLEGRVVGGLTGWENLGKHLDEMIAWVYLAFSTVSTDLVLQLQELGRSRALNPTANSVKGVTG